MTQHESAVPERFRSTSAPSYQFAGVASEPPEAPTGPAAVHPATSANITAETRLINDEGVEFVTEPETARRPVYLHVEMQRPAYEDGNRKIVTEFVTFVIPMDARVKYEPNQATLLVIDPSGNHIAGWRNVHEFRRDDIEKTDDDVFCQEALKHA